MAEANKNDDLEKEAEAFDEQILERIEKGFVPDLRNLKKVAWFYNNPWREPKFAEIQWFPTIDLIISNSVQAGKRALEVGCGNGMLSLEMARNGLSVTGIDLSPKSIEVAEEYSRKNTHLEGFGSLEYICGDFFSAKLSKESFDSIVFFRTLHHFPAVRNSIIIISRHYQILHGNFQISKL